jgi:hypothetical protein
LQYGPHLLSPIVFYFSLPYITFKYLPSFLHSNESTLLVSSPVGR